MKTMMSIDGDKIRRVSDEKASELFHEGGYRYVSKSMWKEQVRDIDKPTEEPTKEKNNKMSRATKRHLRKSKK